MSPSDLFGIAAHMHVLLRRKTGRVTDTEWMACNAEYAREIARFARERARVDGHVELLVWAEKLESAIAALAPPPRKPLLQSASEALRAGQVEPGPGPDDASAQAKYIGRLR